MRNNADRRAPRAGGLLAVVPAVVSGTVTAWATHWVARPGASA